MKRVIWDFYTGVLSCIVYKRVANRKLGVFSSHSCYVVKTVKVHNLISGNDKLDSFKNMKNSDRVSSLLQLTTVHMYSL